VFDKSKITEQTADSITHHKVSNTCAVTLSYTTHFMQYVKEAATKQ